MDTSRTIPGFAPLGFYCSINELLFVGVSGNLSSLPSSLTAESFHLDAEETGKDTKQEKYF